MTSPVVMLTLMTMAALSWPGDSIGREERRSTRSVYFGMSWRGRRWGAPPSPDVLCWFHLSTPWSCGALCVIRQTDPACRAFDFGSASETPTPEVGTSASATPRGLGGGPRQDSGARYVCTCYPLGVHLNRTIESEGFVSYLVLTTNQGSKPHREQADRQEESQKPKTSMLDSATEDKTSTTSFTTKMHPEDFRSSQSTINPPPKATTSQLSLVTTEQQPELTEPPKTYHSKPNLSTSAQPAQAITTNGPAEKTSFLPVLGHQMDTDKSESSTSHYITSPTGSTRVRLTEAATRATTKTTKTLVSDDTKKEPPGQAKKKAKKVPPGQAKKQNND